MRLWLSRLLLLLASVGFVALVAEVGLRFVDLSPAEVVHPERPPVDPDLPVLRSLHDLMGPNIRGIRSGVFFRTNNKGIRGPDVPSRPPRGVFRIGVAGDSVTMGAGVLEEEAYTALLPALLGPRREQEIEALNFGLGGLDAGAVTRRMKVFAGVYQPHMLVWGYTINDIQGPSYRALSDEDTQLSAVFRQDAFLRSRSHLLRFAGPRLSTLHAWWFPRAHPILADYDYNYFENEAAWREVEDALDRMRVIALRSGSCAHLFVHTHFTELSAFHPFRRIYDKVERAARERGIFTSQSFDAVRGRYARSLWITPVDPHPNPEAHRLFAGALADGLDAMPDYCWALGPERERGVRAAMPPRRPPRPLQDARE